MTSRERRDQVDGLHQVTAGCSFCHISQNRSRNWIDKPIFETNRFVAVPTLGSIVSGWVMIVPKQHVLNASGLYNDDEFKLMKAAVIEQLKAKGDRIHMFEHGATAEGSSTGCGVDHAHVHFVAMEDDLTEQIEQTAPELKWQRVALRNLTSSIGAKEYLLHNSNVLGESGTASVALLDSPASQFFRKVIAARVGVSEKYDYRKYGFENNIAETYSYFSDDEFVQLHPQGLNGASQTV